MSDFINGFEIEEFNVHGFNIGGKVTGKVYSTCPFCSESRKKKSEKCATVWLDDGWFKCSHCGEKGQLHTYKKKNNVVYVKPEWKNKTDLSNGFVKYFETRGITQDTLIKAKITEGTEWMPKAKENVSVIEFNYFKKNELINVKYRAKNKDFKLFSGGELIPYNLDFIEKSDECYIVEGEMDALSLMEIGIFNVVSVPNGATLGANNLIYLNNSIEYFIDKKKIYLCLDDDEAGRNLRNQIAERLGYDKCSYIVFDGCKDANDFLKLKGAYELREAIKLVKEFPMTGVFTIQDIYKDIEDMYFNGLDRGVSPRIDGFNLNFVSGYITTITGIPSHGKSQFLDFITLSLLRNHNWTGAFYSPENKPTQLHFSKMARIIIGKSWYGEDRITQNEVSAVAGFLNEAFWFVKPEKDFTLETILRDVKMLIERKGIKFFVIDAWNRLEHKYAMSETKYIGDSLDMISNFCEVNHIHCFLVAHPTKMRKLKDSQVLEMPNLYDISGSSNFYNKSDNGICVYRDFEQDITIINIIKVKFDHWGESGLSEYHYDKPSGRYYKNSITKDTSRWIKVPEEITQTPEPF